MDRITLVYGNHGSGLQVEDLLATFRAGFAQLGIPADLEKKPVPGGLNLLIENFGSHFTREIEASDPRTRFWIVATEFATGEGFNDFGGWRRWAFAERLQHKLRRARRRRRERRGQEPLASDLSRHHYALRHRWRRRFENFLRVSRRADAIWCLSEHQVDAYRRVTGSGAVYHCEFGFVEGIEPLVHRSDSEKDVDFLFTGTLTPYRDSILGALRRRGYRAESLDAGTPRFVREEFVSRAKICLNLKQFPEWRYPSVVRFHYHLMNRSLLLTERTQHDCELSDYVPCAESGRFVEACEEMLAKGGYNARALALYEKYRAGTSMKRSLARLIERSQRAAREG